jgi:hypothetical protein
MAIDPVIRGATVLILLFLLLSGGYLIYAVVRKRPLADPHDSDNFIASLPGWPKSLHRELLVIIGTVWSVTSVVLLVFYLRRWFY